MTRGVRSCMIDACRGGTETIALYRVTSAGPDRTFGTADDLTCGWSRKRHRCLVSRNGRHGTLAVVRNYDHDAD